MFLRGKIKWRKKFVEISQVGICNSANPHLLRRSWSWNLVPRFKDYFQQKAPRVGPTLCFTAGEGRKKYRKTKAEKMLWEITPDWAKPDEMECWQRVELDTRVLQMARVALTYLLTIPGTLPRRHRAPFFYRHRLDRIVPPRNQDTSTSLLPAHLYKSEILAHGDK